MKIISLPRGKGKTTELQLWMLEGHSQGIDRALIVPTRQRLVTIRRRFQDLYFQSGHKQYIQNAANRTYTVDAVLKLGLKHFSACEIAIDDADEVLAHLLGLGHRPISIAAVTEHTSDTTEVEKSVSVD